MPSSTSTNTPKSAMLGTLPLIFVPTGNFRGTSSQRFVHSCCRPRETFSPSVSTLSTTTSSSSPFLNSSFGSRIFCVHEMSETWTRPSMPSSMPTKTPKVVTVRPRPTAAHVRRGWGALLEQRPGVRLGLLHAERDLAVLRIDLEHEHVHLVADRD